MVAKNGKDLERAAIVSQVVENEQNFHVLFRNDH